MSELNSREDWEEFYNERSTERDKVISALSADDDDSLDQLWWFCWYNADKLTDKHPIIWADRSHPHQRHFSVHADNEECFLVKFRDWDKTNSQYFREEIFKVDEKLFAKTLKFFRRDTIQRDNQPVEGKFNIYDKSGAGTKMDCISLRSVLPMISLGIFELGGKDWIEYTDSSKIRVGDSKEYYISFSGPGTSRNPSSIPAETADEETTAEVLEICDLLELRSNVILEGVPGTGKTWIRDKVKIAMDAEMEVVTFHPASTYEEFVGGIFPTSSNDGDGTPLLLFEYQKGTLSRFANRAMDDEERDYILFIDEINRANIPLVMGELLTIIESTKRTKPKTGKEALSNGPNSDEDNPWEVAVHVENDDSKSKYLRLPSNLYILATMNTSDRSVVSMDAALRRRFAYYRIETKLTDNGREEMRTALKKSWWGDKQDTFETVFEILVKINQHLQREIGPDAMLGHSYLFFSDDEVAGLDENQTVSEMMELNILPQIADTLTSMNKTSAEDVDSINKLLRKMPDSMLGHELKSPTTGGKSLDIAVTVCKREVVDNSIEIEDKIELNSDPSQVKSFNQIMDVIGHVCEMYAGRDSRGQVTQDWVRRHRISGVKITAEKFEIENGTVSDKLSRNGIGYDSLDDFDNALLQTLTQQVPQSGLWADLLKKYDSVQQKNQINALFLRFLEDPKNRYPINDKNGVFFFTSDKEKIDSRFSIGSLDDDVHLILHAQGGGNNSQYIKGFERLLEIFADLEIPINEIRNDSSTWKKKADSDSELTMDFDYPIKSWEHDATKLRLDIGRETGSGSPFKRIKFIFENRWNNDQDYIERFFSGILG